VSFSINTNLGALKAFNALAKVNSEAQIAQFKLATGKRINSVADDTSGFKVGKSLESKTMIQKSQLNNASAAKDYLATAETALLQINDLLIQISAKYADAQDPSKSKDAIADDIRSIASEIDSIMKTTKFNDTNLLAQADGSALASSGVFDVGSDFSTDFASNDYLKADVLKDALHGSEAVGVDSYTGEVWDVDTLYSTTAQDVEIKVTYDDDSFETFQFSTFAGATLNSVYSQLHYKVVEPDVNLELTETVIDPMEGTLYSTLATKDDRKIVSFEQTSGADLLTLVHLNIEGTGTSSSGLMDADTDAVIAAASDITEITDNVRNSLGRIGNLTQSLEYKSDFLTSSITNNQSSISRLFDTDMAQEQLNATKGSLASNVGISILSQMNFAPQQLLQLLN